MAKNKPNTPNNSERQAPAGEEKDAPRKAASGGERGSSNASNTQNAGADRGADRKRTEPNLTEEPTRQGKGKDKGKGLNREAVETEGDVEELDEQNQEL